jgi:hypothetical protein
MTADPLVGGGGLVSMRLERDVVAVARAAGGPAGSRRKELNSPFSHLCIWRGPPPPHGQKLLA